MANSMRLLGRLKNPTGGEFDGDKAHRTVLAPPGEHGLVSTRGANGLFYANADGALVADSVDQNWGRLASAAQSRALALVGDKEFYRAYLRRRPGTSGG